MSTALNSTQRGALESAVKKARVIAERGAQAALEAITVHEAKSGSHLDAARRDLRTRLRAHAKQLGDARKANGEQAIGRLIRECAYEHWHRMLFARFLAENDLLIHPEHNVSVSLEDVEELAREQHVDQWELASRFAQRMLPQIFRPDDPVLAVALPRERTLELEQLLESLPAETFKADDSLGWVYQFWQAEEKDRVNASGEKITGETLPAVTQLFTEHYMVLFLLHNTIGAWYAGKKAVSYQQSAGSEEECRRAVALPDYTFEYLRFIRESREGDEEGKPTGLWYPAADTFDGWPREAKDLKLLDPCCGSGHFLVAAFDLLVRLRVAEEGLSLEAAICAVLADNLFGLELDARCTQIAAFNLALAAWRVAGNPIDLPTLNIACSGLGPHASEEEWLRLAEQSGVPMPTLGREAIKNGLLNLHALFSKAPTLGSLIDPSQLPADLIAADYETLQPYLAAALAGEHTDEETHERAVAAAGMVKAAELLAREYTIVVTNVPYLGRGKQEADLKRHLETHFPLGKADLATAFLLRCLDYCAVRGSTALVTPQNWLFIGPYRRMRERLLRSCGWNLVAQLGPRAFETISGEIVNVNLSVISLHSPGADQAFTGLDVSAGLTARQKAESLAQASLIPLVQIDQLKNPDARIVVESGGDMELLNKVAGSFKGIATGDMCRFLHFWWEHSEMGNGWRCYQGSVDSDVPFGGREQAIFWEDRQGALYSFVAEKLGPDGVGAWLRGEAAWGRRGVAVSQMSSMPCTLYDGDLFDENTAAVIPNDVEHLAAVWVYCRSDEYQREVRRIDNSSLKVPNLTLIKVPFDLDHWRSIAVEEYPNGLPAPESDDPTQWLFHGRPEDSTASLQVAMARLIGYRWPAELDETMRLSVRARDLVKRCNELLPLADADGIVCIPAARGERSASDRLLALLSACGIKPDRDLDAWLRESFFEEHCSLFHHRPFVWHIWDGRKDGFHALLNYHRLAGGNGEGRRTLESLVYAYLGSWIDDQKQQVDAGTTGAEARLAAALDLKAELEKILAGEPPYDIFVRWKPLREQPIGWEPDINDGVQLNIRPFLMAKDVGRKGAGLLRCKPNIKWGKDKGKDPQSLRPKADLPWFWSCDPEKHAAHWTDFAGGDEFDGNRWNDLHYTNKTKQQARDTKGGR